VKLAALAAAALLAPSVAAAPPRPPQVVAVSVAHATGPPDAATGFVAGEGLVVTVAHVLADGGSIAAGGRRATVVRLDPRLDLALLRVPGVRGDRPRLAAGTDDTTLLGRPAPVVRRISARVDGGSARPALELRAEVAAGDSGAPVVTASGRLAGVVFARSQEHAGVAYAVDATAVAQLLTRTRR
jgi:S1-C subfamily serine protease